MIVVFFCHLCNVCVPSVLWYCWLGLLTCKNRRLYNLYCVGGDVKPCSINQSINQAQLLLLVLRMWLTDDIWRVSLAKCPAMNQKLILYSRTLFTRGHAWSLRWEWDLSHQHQLTSLVLLGRCLATVSLPESVDWIWIKYIMNGDCRLQMKENFELCLL